MLSRNRENKRASRRWPQERNSSWWRCVRALRANHVADRPVQKLWKSGKNHARQDALYSSPRWNRGVATP